MVVWVSLNITVSVISRTSRVAGNPVERRMSTRSSTNVSWPSWAAERLTVSEMPSPVPSRHGGGLAARLEQHRATEREDRAALLGEGDELVGLDEAAGRVAPAGERLDAVDHARRERQHRLVVDVDLALVHGVGQLRRTCACRATIAACMVGSNTANRFLPACLAVYIATSALRSRSSAWSFTPRLAAMPMLAETCRSWPSTGNVTANAAISRERDGDRGGEVRLVEQEHRELVATEAGRHVAGPDARLDALGDRRQQPVAGRRGRGRR